MTEDKPDWLIDLEVAEKQDGDLLGIYLVSRRRALITELRELNQFLGLPVIVIPGSDQERVR
jgi:hypothetical protein